MGYPGGRPEFTEEWPLPWVRLGSVPTRPKEQKLQEDRGMLTGAHGHPLRSQGVCNALDEITP